MAGLPPQSHRSVGLLLARKRGQGNTNEDVEDVGCVWLDGDEIGCLDGHCVLVDGELEMAICRHIDDPQTMFLARGKRGFILLSHNV